MNNGNFFIQISNPEIYNQDGEKFGSAMSLINELYVGCTEKLFIFWHGVPIPFEWEDMYGFLSDLFESNFFNNLLLVKDEFQADVASNGIFIKWQFKSISQEEWEMSSSWTTSLENSIGQILNTRYKNLNVNKISFLSEWSNLLTAIVGHIKSSGASIDFDSNFFQLVSLLQARSQPAFLYSSKSNKV